MLKLSCEVSECIKPLPLDEWETTWSDCIQGADVDEVERWCAERRQAARARRVAGEGEAWRGGEDNACADIQTTGKPRVHRLCTGSVGDAMPDGALMAREGKRPDSLRPTFRQDGTLSTWRGADDDVARQAYVDHSSFDSRRRCVARLGVSRPSAAMPLSPLLRCRRRALGCRRHAVSRVHL